MVQLREHLGCSVVRFDLVASRTMRWLHFVKIRFFDRTSLQNPSSILAETNFGRLNLRRRRGELARARASGMEFTAGREPRWIRHRAGDCFEPLNSLSELRNRAEQTFGVWMLRTVEQIFDGRIFHDATGVHDSDRVGVFCDDAQVMRDQHDGHASITLEFPEQLENLRLNCHVERGRGFIGDEQFRFDTTAPSQSSRAAAYRRTSGADTH